MSPKRLFDEPADDPSGAARVMVDITPPSDAIGMCAAAVCLRSALPALPYTDLMALLGTAFMLHVEPGFALGGWGLDAVEWLAESTLECDTWLLRDVTSTDTVETDLNAGTALVAHGWDGPDPDWAVICGLDADSCDWCGYGYASGGILIIAPPGCDILIRPSHLPGLDLDTASRMTAIARASSLLGTPYSPVSAYRRWADIIQTPEVFADGPEGDEAIARHEFVSRMLLEARQAAVDFLEQTALGIDEERAGLLTEVSDIYMAVGDLLDARSPAISDPLATMALRNADVRADWARILLDCADMEGEALALLGRT